MKYHNPLTFPEKVAFQLLRATGCLLAALPRFVRLGIADINFAVLYYIVRYRRKVTRENLLNSFPDKPLNRIRKIERNYYRHLGDVFLDSMAVIGMSEKTIRKHFIYDDTDFQAFNRHSPVICAMAHYGSWEYTNGYKLRTGNPLFPVYRPVYTKSVDEFFYRMRSRFGAEPCPMSAVVKRILKHRGENFIMAMLADQAPLRNERERWYTFLNQDTQFFTGIGQMAKRYGIGVYFLDVRRLKRGYYYGKMVRIYDGKEDIPYDVIVERYLVRLERMIRRNPALWTWSHKRWKHKKLF